MSSTQTPLPPAESGETGLPHILTVPADVPEARAFYSSSPDAKAGIDERPDGLDEIEMALISNLAKRQPNGKEEEILHALRYMRLIEGRVPEGEVTGAIDGETALKGLKWIRKNVKDEDIHRSVVSAKTTLDGEYTSQQELQRAQRNEVKKEKSAQDQPVTKPRRSKRVLERRAIREERLNQQRQHQAERQAEVDLLTQWQEDQPPVGANYLVGSLEHLDTVVKPSGEVMVVEKDGFRPMVADHMRALVANPAELFSEYTDIDIMNNFLYENHDLAPILGDIFEYANRAVRESWPEQRYETPEAFREAFSQWLEVFKGFSTIYRDSVSFRNNDVHNDPNMEDPVAKREGQVNYNAISVLQKSLSRLAITHHEEFFDLVYDSLQAALETDDEFIRDNTLHIVGGTIVLSATANTLLFNVPLVEEIDKRQKLRSADMRMALEEVGCNVNLSKRDPSDYNEVPRKVYKRYYRVARLAQQLGLDPTDPGTNAAVYGHYANPLFKAIDNSELPGSLTMQIRRQKS